MSGLHEAFDEIVADVPVYGDLDRAIEQAGRERRHRSRVVAGLASVAAVAAAVAGLAAINDDGNHSLPPIAPSPTPRPSPTPTPTETKAPASKMTNGRLAGAERHFAAALEPCFVLVGDREQTVLDIRDWVAQGGGDCMIGVRDVNVSSGLAVFEEQAPADLYGDPDPPDQVAWLRVGTSDALVARFPCPAPCDYPPALGPGSDEISIPDGSAVKVIGFDGRLRRNIDLSAAFPPAGSEIPTGAVTSVAWSPDRSRVAVVTRHPAEGRIWILDRDGGQPQLVHTTTNTEEVPPGSHPLVYLSSLAWSPDGNRLAFIEELAYIGDFEESLSTRAVILGLPGSGSSVPRTLYDYPRSGAHDMSAVVWSPDGTRVALKVPGHVLELSPDDGRVLARHPDIDGTLIWLARAEGNGS